MGKQVTFWAEAERLLGSQLGSLEDPWVSVAREGHHKYDHGFNLTLWIGRPMPAVVLRVHAQPTVMAELRTACCRRDLTLKGKRFACDGCGAQFLGRLSELRTYPAYDLDAVTEQVAEWLDFTSSPLEAELLAQPLARWLHGFGGTHEQAWITSGERDGISDLTSVEDLSGPVAQIPRAQSGSSGTG